MDDGWTRKRVGVLYWSGSLNPAYYIVIHWNCDDFHDFIHSLNGSFYV